MSEEILTSKNITPKGTKLFLILAWILSVIMIGGWAASVVLYKPLHFGAPAWVKVLVLLFLGAFPVVGIMAEKLKFPLLLVLALNGLIAQFLFIKFYSQQGWIAAMIIGVFVFTVVWFLGLRDKFTQQTIKTTAS